MLRAYIYYSVGGYKEMYLGTDRDSHTHCYYLPLLAVYQQRLKENEDAALRDKVDQLSRLPQIGIITNDDNYGLPSRAITLFSRGEYKLYYGHLEEDCHIILLRDIESRDRDETNRTAPFAFALTCDEKSDIPLMERLTCYMATNTKTASSHLSSLVGYDVHSNGLKADLAGLFTWINQVIAQTPEPSFRCGNQQISISSAHNRVGLLVLPIGLSADTAITGLKLQDQQVCIVASEKIGNMANESTETINEVSRQEHQTFEQTLLGFIASAQKRTGLSGWRFWGVAIIAIWITLKLLKWLLF